MPILEESNESDLPAGRQGESKESKVLFYLSLFRLFSNLRLSQQGFAQLFYIIILLLGLAVGVYLATHPTVFNPKAFDPNQAARITSLSINGPYQTTPINELANIPKPPSFKLWPGQIAIPDDPASYDIAAKMYDLAYVYNNDNQITQLKQRNPNIKIIVRLTNSVFDEPISPIHEVLNSDETNFLHTKAGPPSPSTRIAQPGYPTRYTMNFYSPQARQNILNAYINYANSHPLVDGFEFTTYVPNWAGFMPSNGCYESDLCNLTNTWPQLTDFWLSGYINLNNLLKSQIPNKIFTVDGFNPDWPPSVAYGPYQTGFLNPPSNLDGFYAEHMELMYPNPNHQFDRSLENIDIVKSMNKIFLFNAQPGLLSETEYSSYPQPPKDINLERFYLATFLLINGPGMYFAYNPGYPEVEQGTYFYKDFFQDYGAPNQPYAKIGEMFVRSYNNGIVLVNPTDQNQSYTLPTNSYNGHIYQYQVWDPYSGGIVPDGATVTLAPHTGNYYFAIDTSTTPNPTPTPINSPTDTPSLTPSLSPFPSTSPPASSCQPETLQCPPPQNGCFYEGGDSCSCGNLVCPTTTPSSTPTPTPQTPSPTPTSQPPTKIGDINGNDKVDVFDLSILLSNYNRKSDDPQFNSNADLRKDNVINVFDLSILLSHYGS